MYKLMEIAPGIYDFIDRFIHDKIHSVATWDWILIGNTACMHGININNKNNNYENSN